MKKHDITRPVTITGTPNPNDKEINTMISASPIWFLKIRNTTPSKTPNTRTETDSEKSVRFGFKRKAENSNNKSKPHNSGRTFPSTES